MVWGVRFPTDYSEFSPRGGYNGYEEALAAHYKAVEKPGLTPQHPVNYVFTVDRPQQSDGEPYISFTTYSRDVSEKFHSEIGVPRPHHPALLPVLSHEWPTEYVYEKIYKRPASLVKFPNRMYAVDEKLRDLIERLEPGAHQFHPIRVMLPKGVEHPIRFHMMIVRTWLNSFSLAKSDPNCLRDKETKLPIVFMDHKRFFAGVAMDQAKIGQSHIWRERALRGAEFFISDELKRACKAEGLRLPPQFEMKSV